MAPSPPNNDFTQSWLTGLCFKVAPSPPNSDFTPLLAERLGCFNMEPAPPNSDLTPILRCGRVMRACTASQGECSSPCLDVGRGTEPNDLKSIFCVLGVPGLWPLPRSDSQGWGLTTSGPNLRSKIRLRHILLILGSVHEAAPLHGSHFISPGCGVKLRLPCC